MTTSIPTSKDDLPLVAPLADFDRESVSLAGGKGANLGELIKAGFPVPEGFVISTRAYDRLLQSHDLNSAVSEILTSLSRDDMSVAAEASQKVRAAFQNVSIPEPVTNAILKAYRQLGGNAVAVRSSATAEDLPTATFAGQQETFLNVIGEQALLEAVRSCWISLWSERAILYRAHQNVEQASVKLAVVVQKMVQADMAGVMFTSNPVSGDTSEFVIDANPGLGEAVVSGMATPDHSVLEKHGLRVKAQVAGRREVIVRSKTGGDTEQTVPNQDDLYITLPVLALRNLAKLGVQIERHYGVPQDIEWAWIQNGTEAGECFILQARPVTALPKPVKVTGPMRMVLPMLAEMWPERPYPLDVTTFTGALEHAVGSLLAEMVGGSAPDPKQAMREEEGVVVRFEPPIIHPSPTILITPWLTLWRTRRNDPARWQADPILAEVIALASELEQRDLHTLTWNQNIVTLREALDLIPQIMRLREKYFPQALLGLGILWLLLSLVGRKDRFGALVSGVETKTTETNRALEFLAAQIRDDPALHKLFASLEPTQLRPALQQTASGQRFLQEFTAFLAQYGHRETALVVSQPAWKDQPEAVLGILKMLASGEPQAIAPLQVWQRTRDALLSGTWLGRWPLRRLFLKALTNARCLFQIREDTHFYATLTQPLVRRVALELGARLEQVGALIQAEDIFHLKLAELEVLGDPWPPAGETILQIQTLVARRQAKRKSLEHTPFFDPGLLIAGLPTQANEDVLLRGAAGSPGIASGPARIIHDVMEFGRLQPGDVLVAPVTNPAWTPLFQRAAAVVVDTGGPASHAAIVAREYGLPAVMGTMTGTHQLYDGQWIRVDGSRGLVLKAKS